MKSQYKVALAVVGMALTIPAFQNFSVAPRSAVVEAPACFTDELNNQIASINGKQFQLIHEAPTPGSSSPTHQLPSVSANYPGTHYSTGQIQKLGMAPKVSNQTFDAPKQSAWLWGNRCVSIEGVTPENPKNPMMGCTNKSVFKGNWYRQMVPIANAQNKIQFNSKGDPLMLRPIFSTLHRANVCTQMQTRRVVLGTPDSEFQVLADKAGLKIISMPADDATPWFVPQKPFQKILPASAQPIEDLKTIVRVNGQDLPYLADVCILEPAIPGGMHGTISGVTIDWEVWDNRPTIAVTSLFDRLKDILSPYPDLKLIVFTNDLTTGGRHNGITPENAQEILTHVDYLSPLVWTGAAPAGPEGSDLPATSYKRTMSEDYDRQLEILQATGKLSQAQFGHLLFTLSVYYDDCTAAENQCANQLSDLGALRKQIMTNTKTGFMIFKDGVKEIGDQSCSATSIGVPVNQVMACLAFGRCNGDFNGSL